MLGYVSETFPETGALGFPGFSHYGRCRYAIRELRASDRR